MRKKTIPRSYRCAKYRDYIYTVPINGPFDAKYFHADIPDMNETQCRREHERVRLRLLLDPRPCPWLLDRFDALAERLEVDA